MKGSIKWQVTEIFKEIKEIGNSKYDAKNEAREAGAHGSHEIAEKIGIYGYRTNDAYTESAIRFGDWAKENLHLKDLTKTTAADAKAYLDSRIADGIAHKTFQLDKAALNKFQVSLNKYSQSHNLNRTYDFKLNETFRDAHKSLEHADVRAYSKADVDKILKITNPAVNLAVRAALGAGLRKSEILKLSADNLKADRIEVLGAKGGKNRTVSVINDKNLISDIKAFLKENNIQKFGDAVNSRKINYEISKVTGKSGSAHKLRHNYAINTITGFGDKGYSKIESEHYTSEQLGHERTEIIEGVYSK